MEAWLAALLKEVLSQTEPQLIPRLLVLAAAGLLIYHAFVIPKALRRIAALEADRLSATAFEREMDKHGRRQDALAQGIMGVMSAVGRKGEAAAWHLTYLTAAAVAPSGELRAREWTGPQEEGSWGPRREGDQG